MENNAKKNIHVNIERNNRENHNIEKIYLIILKKYSIITVAAVGYGMGIAVFLDSNNLVPGGISGLSIIVSRLTEIRTGSVFFLLNIPILALGMWKFGLKFIFDSLYAISVSSVTVNLSRSLPVITEDILIAALAGGAAVSVCIGLIFRQGATTGGMDIIVLLLKQRYKHLKTGTIFLMADSFIVMLSAFVFENVDYAFYSAITVVTSSMVLDMVLYGRDEARLMYIILREEHYEKLIAERLLNELEVGVTYLKGYGGYQNTDKKVILCAVHKNQLPKAKEIVRDTDDNAFLIVTSANEIMGEGYKSHYSSFSG